MATATEYLADPAFIDEIVQGVVDEVVDLALAVTDSMQGPDGRVWPYIAPSRDQRLLSFVDDAQRGIVDKMQQIAPRQADRLIRTAHQDARALGVAPESVIPGRFLPPVRKAS